MAEEDAKMIEKYKNGIKQTDRVTEEVYESRLAICKECDLLNAGTCGACGCYVELRAAAKVGKCPHKLWQKCAETIYADVHFEQFIKEKIRECSRIF